VIGDLHWVESWYDCVHGRIQSNWCKREGRLVMDVVVPANTTAMVYVPATDPQSVEESGRSAKTQPGVSFLRLEDGRAVFEVGSGRYIFRSTVTGRSRPQANGAACGSAWQASSMKGNHAV
jgi:alpha-L-rhamnosidase